MPKWTLCCLAQGGETATSPSSCRQPLQARPWLRGASSVLGVQLDKMAAPLTKWLPLQRRAAPFRQRGPNFEICPSSFCCQKSNLHSVTLTHNLNFWITRLQRYCPNCKSVLSILQIPL